MLTVDLQEIGKPSEDIELADDSGSSIESLQTENVRVDVEGDLSE